MLPCCYHYQQELEREFIKFWQIIQDTIYHGGRIYENHGIAIVMSSPSCATTDSAGCVS